MTKYENLIRTFFQTDNDNNALIKFFDAVSNYITEEGFTEKTVIEILNEMIVELMDFSGPLILDNDNEYIQDIGIDKEYRLDFVAGSNYAEKILNETVQNKAQLQAIINEDVKDAYWEIQDAIAEAIADGM